MSKEYFIMNLKTIKIFIKFIYLFFLSVFLSHSLNVEVNISDIFYTFNATFKNYLVNKKINYYFDYPLFNIFYFTLNK